MRYGKTKSINIGNIIIYCLLTLFAVVMVLPFYWTLLTSLRYNEDMFSLPIKWFSTRFTLEHYIRAFTTVPFARYFANSFYLAVMGVLTNLFFGSLGGYAFAKLRFRGKKLIFKVLLSSIMIPGVVTMIPQFLLLKNFPLIGGNNILGQGGTGFLNTYWAIILPGAARSLCSFYDEAVFPYIAG